MIIKTIKLDPCGGISGKEIPFTSGINVILGSNEAGKSTVFNAVQKALLVPTKLGKKDFEKEIKRLLPIGGGDTVAVEMHFEKDGKSYTLKKKWGGTKLAELILPDGSIITDDDAVAEKMNLLLPAKTGTVKTVLMTYQSGLENTLSDFNKEPYAVHELGDILRKTILETDGISVDAFKDKINRQYDDYFGRWDRIKKGPEGDRGINNPWIKGSGYILSAFYEKEKLRVYHQNTLIYEEDLDTLNRELSVISQRVAEKDIFIKANKKVVEDARERRVLTAELANIQNQVKDLKKANEDWPVFKNQIDTINKEIPGLKEKEAVLQSEAAAAKDEQSNKILREKFKKANEKKEVLSIAEKELQQTKELTNANLESIRKSFSKVENLKTSLAAGRLVARLKAKKDFSVLIQKDLEPEYQKEIKIEDVLQLTAGGALKLDHADWSLELTTGEGDFEAIKKRCAEAKDGLEELLKEHGVATLEEAVAANDKYGQRLKEAEKAKEVYLSELGNETYAALEQKIKEIGDVKETRQYEMVYAELIDLRKLIESKNTELERYQNAIAEYTAKYGSHDQILMKLAGIIGEEAKIKEKLNALAPLPEGVTDYELFIEEYEKIQEELSVDKNNLSEIEKKRIELTARMPDESSEEIEKMLKDAQEHFDAILRRGEAIARIKDLTEEMLKTMDTGTYKGLEDDVANYVAAITNNKYTKIKMEGSLPQGFIRSDGKTIVYDLLSHGTKDALCLALRLSMASHFLKEAKGFLAMDDPLVNIDPSRQKKAAEVLREFAKEKQVIIFTCHPNHAQLLGGNQIML